MEALLLNQDRKANGELYLPKKITIKKRGNSVLIL
jgi:hypothetical protein